MRQRIGFIGLGNMGRPMAETLCRAGFPMTVLDLKPEAMAALVGLGASAALSPRAVAEASDIVCSVVMNDRQTLEVMLGEDGVLAGARPGSAVLIHSTVMPETCRQVADAAAARGVGVLDAAVSGAAERARLGTLTLMVGGDAALVERCRPVLETVGGQVFHMGGVGMGQVAKICNNLMTLVNIQVAEEAIRLAATAGIEEPRLRALAEASSGDSWALRHLDDMRGLAALTAKGPVDMSIFGRKDISLAVKLAHALETRIPITELVFERAKH